MTPKFDISGVPKSIQISALFIALYGIIIALNALWFGLESGFEDKEGAFRAFIRCGASLMIAWELINLKRWAWWVGVLFSGLLGSFGLIGIVTLSFAAPVDFPVRQLIVMWISFPLLVISFVVLLLKSSREAIKSNAILTTDQHSSSG